MSPAEFEDKAMKMRRHTLTLLIAIALTASVPARGQSNSPSAGVSLDARVRAEISQFKGKVSLFAKNLDTGESYLLNGDERVPTASTIKIAVMIEAFARVAEGRAKWTDELVLTKAARYGGFGVLSELFDGLPLTLRRFGRPMMLVGDSTPPNIVLDIFF